MKMHLYPFLLGQAFLASRRAAGQLRRLLLGQFYWMANGTIARDRFADRPSKAIKFDQTVVGAPEAIINLQNTDEEFTVLTRCGRRDKV